MNEEKVDDRGKVGNVDAVITSNVGRKEYWLRFGAIEKHKAYQEGQVGDIDAARAVKIAEEYISRR